MSRKDKIAEPLNESFRLSFGAIGQSSEGKKSVIKEGAVKWRAASKPSAKRRKAG